MFSNQDAKDLELKLTNKIESVKNQLFMDDTKFWKQFRGMTWLLSSTMYFRWAKW